MAHPKVWPTVEKSADVARNSSVMFLRSTAEREMSNVSANRFTALSHWLYRVCRWSCDCTLSTSTGCNGERIDVILISTGSAASAVIGFIVGN